MSRNQTPRSSRSGHASHRRISRPRAGYVASKIGRNLSIAFRACVSAGITRMVPMSIGFHPSSRASAGASRRFRSRVDSRSCRSAISVLTSTTRTARVPGCQARTSIDPCSPRRLNVCSGNMTQPEAASRATTSRTIAACFSSSSFGSSAPRQRGAERQPDPHRTGDPANQAERRPLDITPFDSRDNCLADPGRDSDVDLAKAAPNPDRPNDHPNSDVVHWGNLGRSG